MRVRALVLAALACGAATTASAIVSRHDVDPVASPDEAARFAAVCKMLPDGEGVLLAPRWVLRGIKMRPCG